MPPNGRVRARVAPEAWGIRMPQITVQAVVTGPRGVLLLRDGAVWRLPGGVLLGDDDVDDAIVRELGRDTGIEATQPEFLDTFYERLPDGETAVHNLYHLTGIDHAPGASAESRWIASESLGELPLAAWLRDALAVVFGDAEPALPDLAALNAMIAPPPDCAPIIVLTGPAAAGKSTTARELCRRFPRAAHIDVDYLRWGVIRSGYVAPVGLGGEPVESGRQAQLAAHNAVSLARNLSDAGFVAVIDGVLETTADLDMYLERLPADRDVYVVTLLPDAATLVARDLSREPRHQMGTRCEQLRQIIDGNGETRGLRLDTSAMTVEDAVDTILERLREAAVPLTDAATLWEATR